jgi:hypothetical protein
MRQRFAMIVAGALCAACWLMVPASAQSLTWSRVHSANQGSASSFLAAVSCTRPAACTAVGNYLARSSGAQRTLAESWNGARWSVMPSPNRGRDDNVLEAVSCVSTDACMAVGYYEGTPGGTLAESWDGIRWSVLPSPSPGGTGDDLSGVSCVSADACTAVGAATNSSGVVITLIEFWDGTRWSQVHSPNPDPSGNGLTSVSCASADACMAVGFSGNNSGVHTTLAESWDGTRWSVLPTPSPGTNGTFLDGVSCVSAHACTAAGNAFDSNGLHASLIESWDGTHWSVVPSPSPGIGYTQVNGVSCASADACSVTGYYNTKTRAAKTLVESWTGTHWSLTPTPNPGINPQLDGVSCASTTTCTAVGFFYFGGHGIYRTLIESGPASG